MIKRVTKIVLIGTGVFVLIIGILSSILLRDGLSPGMIQSSGLDAFGKIVRQSFLPAIIGIILIAVGIKVKA